MTIGLHTVTLTPLGGGAAADVSCLVDSVSLKYGREDTDSQPEAASCTLEMSWDSEATSLPGGLDIGASVLVTTTLLGQPAVTRFAGQVTDISQGWEEAGEDTPDRVVAQVMAMGMLANLGRRIVGDVPWPQQLDGARVSAIMAAAGVVLSGATSDPGTVQILARDVDSQAALDLAQEVASDAGGVLWATPAGDIRYADAQHRRGTLVALALDACDILVTPTWRRTTEGMVNGVSIGYGVAPDGGEQPRYVAERADSKARYGEWELVTSTQLAAAADAQAMGLDLLTNNSHPVWVLGALPLDVVSLSAEDTAILLGLQMHDLVSVTGMPAAGSVPTSTSLWVEGWSESLAWGAHSLELVVSGYCRTAPAPRWDDVKPETTWDSAPGTWDDASCMGPPVNLGRWNDQPASLRWNQVDPATTWDNYTPTTS